MPAIEVVSTPMPDPRNGKQPEQPAGQPAVDFAASVRPTAAAAPWDREVPSDDSAVRQPYIPVLDPKYADIAAIVAYSAVDIAASAESAEAAIDILRRLYPKDELLRASISDFHDDCNALGIDPWSQPGSLSGLRFLDLGCGVDYPYLPHLPDEDSLSFPPTWARLAATFGADVTGVDVRPSFLGDKELYAHVLGNVVAAVLAQDLGTVAGVHDGDKFDLIHMSSLIDGDPDDIGTAEPFVAQMFKRLGLTAADFKPALFRTVADLLVENGVFSYEGTRYRIDAG